MTNSASQGASVRRCWVRPALLGFGILVFSFATGPIAHGEPQQVVYTQVAHTLEASDDPSFNTLVQRAEGEAAGLITRAFSANPTVTAVSVQIGADRYGKVSPILSVAVSRADWQANPSVQAWAQYLPAAAVLLGFRELGPRSVASAQVPGRSGNPSNPDNEPNFYQ
jgi:hypothetical protein